MNLCGKNNNEILSIVEFRIESNLYIYCSQLEKLRITSKTKQKKTIYGKKNR